MLALCSLIIYCYSLNYLHSAHSLQLIFPFFFALLSLTNRIVFILTTGNSVFLQISLKTSKKQK